MDTNNNKIKQDAVKWLSNEIENIPNFVTNRTLKETTELTIQNNKPPLCQLVLFKYDAIYGNVNGYWDEYPISLIVRPFEDHFFGFNLHYITQKGRIKIFDVLNNIYSKKINSEELRFRTIYPFLDGLVKIGIFNHAYKNYKYNNVKSQFVVINPKNYDFVANLPIANLKRNNTK